MADEFKWQVRVYYEDTDAAGVVYFANYLRFMERARTEWLRATGFEHKIMHADHGVLFAVRHLEIDYKLPARLDDLLTVTSKLLQKRGASLRFKQEITNEQDELLIRGEVKVACLNADTLKPVAIPDALIMELQHVN